MTRFLLTCAALALACGGKDEPTTTEGSSSSTTDPGTAQSTSSSSTDPMTGSSTGDLTTTSSTSSTTGPACETAPADCGVVVDGVMSSCPDPPSATSELVVEALGPGQIKITEFGHDSNCNLTITPAVKLLAGNSIFVTYEIGGMPMDGCSCKYDITATLTGLSPGTWTVTVLPYEEKVDVP